MDPITRKMAKDLGLLPRPKGSRMPRRCSFERRSLWFVSYVKVTTSCEIATYLSVGPLRLTLSRRRR